VPTLRQLGFLLAAGAALLIGFEFSPLVVPELAVGHLPPRAFFLGRFRDLAAAGSFDLVTAAPQVRLVAWNRDGKAVAELTRGRSGEWVSETARRPFVIEVSQRAYLRHEYEGRFAAYLSLTGQPWYVFWEPLNVFAAGSAHPESGQTELDAIRHLLQQRGERLEVEEAGSKAGNYLLLLSNMTSPAQYVYLHAVGPLVRGARGVGTPAHARLENERLTRHVVRIVKDGLLLLICGCLTVVIVIRRKVRWLAGAFLGAVTLAAGVFESLSLVEGPTYGLALLVATAQGLLVMVVWTAAESWLANTASGLNAELDELSSFRVTRETAQRLALGFGWGVVAALIALGTSCLAFATGWLWPKFNTSIFLQTMEGSQNFFGAGVHVAALVLLADAFARRNIKRSPALASFVGSAVLVGLYSKWGPFLLGSLAAAPLALVLWHLLRKAGTVAVLVASIVSSVALPFLIGIQHAAWLRAQWTLSLLCLGPLAGLAVWGVYWGRPRAESAAPRHGAATQPGTTSKKHVFLSYIHEDTSAVAQLRDDLLAHGEKVWWDRDNLIGLDVRDAIRRAMKESYAVVVCFSSNTDSRYESGIFPELADAIEAFRRYRPGIVFLIPVRLSTCTIPDAPIDATRGLADLQCCDLFGEGRELGISDLVAALRRAPAHP
jgi:hypothetical protein